jgi:hypothetical protein
MRHANAAPECCTVRKMLYPGACGGSSCWLKAGGPKPRAHFSELGAAAISSLTPPRPRDALLFPLDPTSAAPHARRQCAARRSAPICGRSPGEIRVQVQRDSRNTSPGLRCGFNRKGEAGPIDALRAWCRARRKEDKSGSIVSARDRTDLERTRRAKRHLVSRGCSALSRAY